MTACSRCGGGLCADCAATSARFRDEFEGIVYTCVKEGGDAACITIWTDCIIKGQTQVTPRTSDTTYRDACLTKKSECDAMGVTFADDRCLLSIIFEESQVAQAMQCLSQPCANIEACFSPIFN